MDLGSILFKISFLLEEVRSVLNGQEIIALSVKNRPKWNWHLLFLYFLHDL